jgi:exodeoxyribonuclease VII small subunit
MTGMTTKSINYRTLNDELAAILDDLQAGTLDIDEALKRYERGMSITNELESYLKQAENSITRVGKS